MGLLGTGCPNATAFDLLQLLKDLCYSCLSTTTGVFKRLMLFSYEIVIVSKRLWLVSKKSVEMLHINGSYNIFSFYLKVVSW